MIALADQKTRATEFAGRTSDPSSGLHTVQLWQRQRLYLQSGSRKCGPEGLKRREHTLESSGIPANDPDLRAIDLESTIIITVFITIKLLLLSLLTSLAHGARADGAAVRRELRIHEEATYHRDPQHPNPFQREAIWYPYNTQISLSRL